MTVTADSYEARVSEAIVQMLADSSNFQEAVEVGTNAVAKNYIVESDGGEETLSVTNQQIDISGDWAVVRLGETEMVERAHLTWGRQGSATVLLVIRPESNETPPESVRRARNTTGLIRDDMQDLIGASATRLAFAIISVGDIVLSDEVGPTKGAYLCHIDINWRDIP